VVLRRMMFRPRFTILRSAEYGPILKGIRIPSRRPTATLAAVKLAWIDDRRAVLPVGCCDPAEISNA
jgi:hypothetical protein